MSISLALQETFEPVEVWEQRARRHATAMEGGHVTWHEWGAGEPVVLLHGGAGSWRHWVRNIGCLTHTSRVLAPDLPSLGESSALSGRWSAEGVVDALAAGLDELLANAERFDLVGFSFGATAAGLLARRLSHRCRTLILVGAGALGTAREPIVLEKVRGMPEEQLAAIHRENLARLMFADASRIDEEALSIQEWNSRHARANSVGLATSSILREALALVTARMGAIWGARDAVARSSLADRIAALKSVRPDICVRCIEGAGHWVAYEAAGSFNDVMLRMLRPTATPCEESTP